MRNKEEITRVIFHVAKKRGWIPIYRVCVDHGKVNKEKGKVYCFDAQLKSIVLMPHFAKKFWGTEIKPRYKLVDSAAYVNLPDHVYQMQQVVIQKDVLDYLKKYIT